MFSKINSFKTTIGGKNPIENEIDKNWTVTDVLFGYLAEDEFYKIMDAVCWHPDIDIHGAKLIQIDYKKNVGEFNFMLFEYNRVKYRLELLEGNFTINEI